MEVASPHWVYLDLPVTSVAQRQEMQQVRWFRKVHASK